MERPILFSGPMVRAILEGRKTQTRRVIKPQPPSMYNWCGWELPLRRKACWSPEPTDSPVVTNVHSVPVRFVNGDRLWVRETFAAYPSGYVYKADYKNDGFGSGIVELATGVLHPLIWKPSIHMPRSASRITLEVLSVRVEHIQEISDEDCLAEGIYPRVERWPQGTNTKFCVPGMIATNAYGEHDDYGLSSPRMAFLTLWNELHSVNDNDWYSNPWVWVIEFKRIQTWKEEG